MRDRAQSGVQARLLQLRGQTQRRQDGNYKGGFNKYCGAMEEVRSKIHAHYSFTGK